MISFLLAASLAGSPQDIKASGVIFGSTPQRSVAILTSQGRTRIVSVGDSVFGGKVVAIRENSVEMSIEGSLVEIRLGPSVSLAATAPQALRLEPTPSDEAPPPPRTMARKDVEKRLATEIPHILADTALQPALEDGRVTGLTVVRMADGTLLSEAGLRQGDVITEINGTSIDGMATLISLWPQLQGATSLSAVVRRGGKSVTLQVALR